MDTMFASAKGGKSQWGNTCAQIFVTDKGFVAAYPLPRKAEVKYSIRQFCKDIGVPTAFICDPAGEQTSKEVRHFILNAGSTLRMLEEKSQWANLAELVIGGVRKLMKDTACPISF